MGWARIITLIVMATVSAISLSVSITGVVLIFPGLILVPIPPISVPIVSIVSRGPLSHFSWVYKPAAYSNTATTVPVVSTNTLVNAVASSIFTLTKHFLGFTCNWMPEFAFLTTNTFSVYMIPTDFGISAAAAATHTPPHNNGVGI